MTDWDDSGDSTVVGDRSQLMEAVQPGRAQHAYVIVIAGPNVGEMFRLGPANVIGRGDRTDIRIPDTEISRRHARVVERDGALWVEDMGSTNGTLVNGDPVRERELRDGDKIQVGTTTILKFSYHDQIEAQFQRQMYESALRDGLTKVFNKKYLLERLESELAYSLRHETPLSLLLLDLDLFKQVNDTHGHLAGDAVLQTLTKRVSRDVRKEDVFARYGGEEFGLLSRGIDLEGAQRFAERMRSGIASEPFVHEGTRIPVTIS
ncbi:MAG: diguanylate cyclase, partial [Polyangiales bacterium]